MWYQAGHIYFLTLPVCMCGCKAVISCQVFQTHLPFSGGLLVISDDTDILFSFLFCVIEHVSACMKYQIRRVVYQLAFSSHHFCPDISVLFSAASFIATLPPSPCSHISPSPDVILRREGGENVRWVSLNHCVWEGGLIVWVLKMTITHSPLFFFAVLKTPAPNIPQSL